MILTQKEIKNLIPHRDPFLFLSRIKIIEVYDSIATAIIYKPRNPHSNMKVGDYILY